MPHVITQSCCSDGSCVYACPVNCIHPSPDEPGFATAEMLYIDPVACVDCGACVSACPVGAIAPDARLTTAQLSFVALNAVFYEAVHASRPAGEKLPPTSKLAPVIPAPEVHAHDGDPLMVAIVGSGPAAMYAADELLTQQGVRVNVFEKLPITRSTAPAMPCVPNVPTPPGPVAPRSWATSMRNVASYSRQTR